MNRTKRLSAVCASFILALATLSTVSCSGGSENSSHLSEKILMKASGHARSDEAGRLNEMAISYNTSYAFRELNTESSQQPQLINIRQLTDALNKTYILVCIWNEELRPFDQIDHRPFAVAHLKSMSNDKKQRPLLEEIAARRFKVRYQIKGSSSGKLDTIDFAIPLLNRR